MKDVLVLTTKLLTGPISLISVLTSLRDTQFMLSISVLYSFYVHRKARDVALPGTLFAPPGTLYVEWPGPR